MKDAGVVDVYEIGRVWSGLVKKVGPAGSCLSRHRLALKHSVGVTHAPVSWLGVTGREDGRERVHLMFRFGLQRPDKTKSFDSIPKPTPRLTRDTRVFQLDV